MAWETPQGVINGVNPPVLTTAGNISDETLVVDGAVQDPGTDYTVTLNIITFLWVLPANAKVRIKYTALALNTAPAVTTFDYSADSIITRIRDVAYAGTSNRDWDTDKLLRLVNAEIEEYLVPFIMQARASHFDTFKDQPLLANQQTYWLPAGATAMKVRALLLVDGAGIPVGKLVERELEDMIAIGGSAGSPEAYAFQGNQIVLFPVPSGSPALFLRVHYLRRPSALVANNSAIRSTGFPGGAAPGFFRVAFAGSAPNGFAAGSTCDLVQRNPGFDVLYTGQVNAQVAGTYVELAGALPAPAVVGDWLTVSGTAPVVTGAIPEMVIGCLVRRCELEVLAGKSDDPSFRRALKLQEDAEKRARQFLNRRNTGDRPKFGRLSSLKFKRGIGGL